MRASVDQDDISFYAPPRWRALVQGSEVATGSAAERRELGEKNGTSHLLADLAGRVARSLDPEIVPPPPASLRSKWGRWLSLVTAIFAFVVAFIAVGRFFPVATASRPQASDRGLDLPLPQQRVSAGLMKGIDTETPMLLREWHKVSVEPAPLPKLQGSADGMVLLSGLADPGSDGAWQVRDAAPANWSGPAKNFIDMNLLVQLQRADATIALRWPMHPDWAVATPAVTVPTAAVEEQRLAVTSPRHSVPSQRQRDPEEIAILVKRGKAFFANGDPASARIMLQRAAESQNAEAALVLAATYDPVVLGELKVHGAAPDVAMARSWYEKAKEFGSEEAPRLLEILASAAR